MSRIISIHEIEEFKLVGRIARTDFQTIPNISNIMENIRKLDEKDHIERFLREIIADHNQTPHGPTEIADILTTKVTYDGKQHIVAFVNKGKSFPKVSAKEVTHQLYRLRTIPNIGLIVLAASGNIQDDAQRDLFQIAQDANVNYLIIDALDLARLFISYNKICPNDGTPFQDDLCPSCQRIVSEPIKITIDIYEDPEYTIAEQREVSFSVKKRYACNVFTDPHYPRTLIREIAKKITWEVRQSLYYASSQNETLYGEKPADCVYLYFYVDIKDSQPFIRNWICRTRWMNPELSPQMAELAWGADEIIPDDRIGEIELEWKKDHQFMRQFANENTATKADWVRKAEDLLRRLDDLIGAIEAEYEHYLNKKLSQEGFLNGMASLFAKASELQADSFNQRFPPPDCADCNQLLLEVTGAPYNMTLIFTDQWRGNTDWKSRIWQFNFYHKNYVGKRNDFNYEWRKIRR
jgi:hypothetical protein